MRRILFSLFFSLLLINPSRAADSTVTALTAAGALGGTELLYAVQGGADRKATPLQMAAYVYGLMSGDATATSGGAVTLATVNANVGTFGSATSCITTTQNAKGLTTAISATTCTPALGSITGFGTGVASALAATLNASTGLVGALTPTNNNCIVGNGAAWTSAACPGGGGGTGANPTATASDVAVNGVAATFMRSDGAPAIQKASSSQFGLVKTDGQTIAATAGVISFQAPINAQVGTTYTVVSGDLGKIITLTNASPVAVTIPIASTGGFGSPFYVSFVNEGAGLVTLTPTTSTIDGAASLTLKQNQSVDLFTDGSNYFTNRGRPTNVAASDLVGIGTNVAAAVNTTLSAAGGLTSTIASGTSALGTSAIGSASCATVVTTSATNTATTDVVLASFNGDPTAVTGYIPATAGMLTIISYPTANNVNFKVCNNTSASITPGAITLNWRVVR